jgi:hypothetical protein
VDAAHDNKRELGLILVLALAAALILGGLAGAGDLRGRPGVFLPAHAALLGLMVGGWLVVRRGGTRTFRAMLVAALLFRLVAAWGEPLLSDDVYRFVWDGRVQLHGIHPYAHAPDDPALGELRDASWERINHPELRTIYPPLSQGLFLGLAALGAGPVGFKLAFGLIDFGVVLLLGLLLRRSGRPRDRLVWYAWNPLAVIEAAGSGHPEPLGAALLVVGVVLLAGGRAAGSAAALGAAIHAKLLPLVLLPGWVRRTRVRGAVVLVLVLVVLWLPYALTGPAVGSGLFDYAERWERNAFVFAGLREALVWLDSGEVLKGWIGGLRGVLGDGFVPWDRIEAHVWPPELARVVVALLLVAWIVRLQLVRRLDAGDEIRLTLGAALLLAPTLHPWYVLWILPFASVVQSWGWLWLAAAVPLAYLGQADVPLWARLVQYVPLYAWGIAAYLRHRRRLLASPA